MAVARYEFTVVELAVQMLYIALSTLLILTGIEMFKKFRAADKKAQTDAAHRLFFLISLALIGYGIYNIPAIYNYFYSTELYWVRVIQQIAVTIIVYPFGILAEQLFILKRVKFKIFTVYGRLIILYLFLLLIIVLIEPSLIVIDLHLLFYPAFLLYALLGISGIFAVMKMLLVELNPQKELRKKVIMGIIFGLLAGFTAFLGGRFRGPPGTNENYWFIIARMLNVAAWVGFREIFISIPTYSEFQWKQGVFELHIIHAKSGISLYSHQFASEKYFDQSSEECEGGTINPNLIGGGITGIKFMLNEISKDSGKLQSIKIGNKSLVFISTENIMCFLLCEKELSVYFSLLTELANKIEETNKDLSHFTGDLTSLNIIPIFNEIFQMNIVSQY